MRKRECPLPRIKHMSGMQYLSGKRPGSIEWVTGMFFLLFLMILLCAEVQLEVFRASGLYLEDALAASNLASAVVDIEEYGISHTVQIADAAEAYERYKDAVKKNLGLDESWQCVNSGLISGTVTVEEYIVYNVEKGIVNISHIAGDGNISTAQGVLGNVTAPNGIPIETTGIYSEISFPVKGLFGITVQAHKGKLADIVATGI